MTDTAANAERAITAFQADEGALAISVVSGVLEPVVQFKNGVVNPPFAA